MKKISMILMAFALAITMSQCKKNEGQTTSNDEVVTITLDVKQNNGSKVVVNPNTGTVDFETGDKIYVGSGGKYVGFLTHNGTNFSGNITNPTENQPLQFYFLGNVIPQETLSAGTTEECSVIISDQTEHLPVISCAASIENYVSGVTAYSAHLLNKCALVKFNVTTASEAATCIIGMKNKVTVDFSGNTLTHSQEGNGIITLPAGSGEKWAILLPQEAVETGEDGTAYSEDGAYTGTRGAVPAITENGYQTAGIEVNVTTEVNPSVVPVGAVNGKFTINAGGDQVYFSQGNLQYQASTNTWRFATNQYDYIGDANSNISSSYNGWIDLFGWGTSGFNHGAICYQPWSTSQTNSDYYAYGTSWYNNLYDQTGMADWGYNSISNGGNTINTWRTLKSSEWLYILDTRNTNSGIRFAMAQVDGMNGLLLLPDNWNSSIYSISNANVAASFTSNIITASQWIVIQNAGAVFLPMAGSRNNVSSSGFNHYATYWSSSVLMHNAGHSSNAAGIYIQNQLIQRDTYGRRYGSSVRLVQNCN